jgi:allograft inflammatory factor 1
MELKMMMQNFDQAKTHRELKKMIDEVDRENRGEISYNDFLFMMLGKKNSVLKMILKFQRMSGGNSKRFVFIIILYVSLF